VLPLAVAPRVAEILGGPVRIVDEPHEPWASATGTVVVAVATGDRYVVQWSLASNSSDRRGMALRLRVGRQLARLAPDLPVPAVLGGDAGAPVPYLVSQFVAGASGRDLLGDDVGAALLGQAMGRMALRLAEVPAAGLRLSRTWSQADLLAPAATRWLEEAGSTVDSATARRLSGVIERLPEVHGGGEPVFAHGDYAPVNVLTRDGSVTAVLDFERARLAHPLFDAAWFRLMIRYHHPDRWPAAGGAFLSAAGMDSDAVTLRRLDALASLQVLEMIASTAARKPERRREWANRLACALG